MPLSEVAQASLDRILRSGEYICRPHRQIFVEHEFKNAQGQVTRKVTREDLLAIADTGNRKAAESGDLSPIGFGHTKEPIRDESGNIVRRFSEEEQPQPRGYLHNYTVEQLPSGRWALFADEWIQKVMPNERGEPVDGIQYAQTFPRRSPEYFPTKKWIDWLALLRTAPALDMGLDLYQYASLFPEKIHYSIGNDGAALVGAVEDSVGKWRYAAREEEGDEMGDDTPPTGNPAGPPDDRPPIQKPPDTPTSTEQPPGGLHELHKKAAEQYSLHTFEMHPSQSKTLMHHMHSMYGAQLGLPADKHAPHVPPPPVAPAAPGAVPGAAPGAPPPAAPATPAAGPPHQQHSPVGLQGDNSWQHGGTPPGPGAGQNPHPHHQAAAGPGTPTATNAYIPGSEEEKRRMSAVQQGIQHQQFATEIDKLRYENQELAKRFSTMEREKRKSDYERDLTGLLGMGYRFTLAEEVEDGARWDYAAEDCKRQIERIKKNYARPTDGDNGPVLLYSHDGADVVRLPSRNEKAGDPEGVDRETARKAQKYMAKHGTTFDQAVAKVREGAA